MEPGDQPSRGRFAGREHRFPVRVYFEDTDLSGVVYHANYLRFMERARSDMLAAAGIDQRAAWEAGDGVYVVADLAIRYRRPARLDDELLIVSRLAGMSAASATIHQRVMLNGGVLTEATVLAAFVAPGGGGPRRQPRAWLTIFKSLMEED